jgi:lipoprotein-anchoring transpeptidase ErfK/SrfK
MEVAILRVEAVKEAAMIVNKRDSWTSALVTMLFMTAISALAEEKTRCDATINKNKADLNQDRRIVISLQDRKLALLVGDQIIKIWDTAVGAESSPSPSGNFVIVNRLNQPYYYHPGKVIPSGPSNPLGTRWLGLSLKGFGIHGTNAPGSIGKKASHGCIRMRNRDIEELFKWVKAGDAVEIYPERDPSLAQIFKIDDSPAPSSVLMVSAHFISSN